MAKLSGTAVLLIVGVPLSMFTLYTCAMLAGIQVGQALERGSNNIEFTWRVALDYVSKELWDFNVLGRRGGGRRGGIRVVVPSNESYFVPLFGLDPADVARDKINKRADATSSIQRHYKRASPRGVISVGSWGGSGGQPFYMDDASTPRLRSIIVYHSGAIHSLSCEYTLAGDFAGPQPRVAGPWGLPDSYGSRAVRTKIVLRPGEHITAVKGTTGQFANVPSVVITSLTFHTSAGRKYGPYGSVAGVGLRRRFSVPADDGACIVGFWGRSGWLLDAIGVYMKRSCLSSSDTAAYNKYYASRRQGRN